MNRFKRKLPSANTVRRNATATISIPTTGAYRGLTLLLTKDDGTVLTEAEMKKTIKKVRLLVNAQCRFEASAKHIIDLLNRYRDLPVSAGILYIPLADTKHKSTDAQDLLSWGMANVTTFEMEIEIADVAEADDLRISGEALIDNVKRELGYIKEVHEFTYAAPGAGNFEIADLPKFNGGLFAMHFDSANKVKGLEYKVDNTTYIEGNLNSYNETLKREGERVPQAGYVHHDPCFMNRLLDVFRLDDKKDIRYYLDMIEAQSLTLTMETISAPLGVMKA